MHSLAEFSWRRKCFATALQGNILLDFERKVGIFTSITVISKVCIWLRFTVNTIEDKNCQGDTHLYNLFLP